MRDPIVLLVHLVMTLMRLLGPGETRSVLAESLLIKHQLLIDRRSQQRAPNLCIVAGLVHEWKHRKVCGQSSRLE